MSISNEDIREIQLVQLDILKEFDRICKKHDIHYQLFAGTLLGCVRHKGFIPWDDDIDICMLRADYDKFRYVSKKELASEYYLQTYDTDPDYYKQSSRIRKNETTYLQDIYMYLDIHHGIPISIMPFDVVKPYSFKGKVHRIIYHTMFWTFNRLNHYRIKNNCKLDNSQIKSAIKHMVYFISNLIPKKLTDILHTSVATFWNDSKERTYVTHLTNGATEKRYFAYMQTRDKFLDTVMGEFEGHQFPIPRNYDEVLTNLFGDYMELPPEDQRQPHHGVLRVDTKNAIWN